MPKKVDRRISKTRKSIKESFISLLSHKDISEITITELSEHADINRKTFYSHYSSVENILEAIGEELKDKLIAILPSKENMTKELDLPSLFKSLNTIIDEDFDFYQKIIFSDSHMYILEDLKSYLKDQLIKEYLEKFSLDKEIYLYYTEFLASGIVSMYIEWFKSSKTVKLEDLGELASGIISSSMKEVLPI